MLLVDHAGHTVLRVEQDGPCVRETIPAGRYTAEFHHGASPNADRDVLFIIPRDHGALAAGFDEGATAEHDDDASPPESDAPTPQCAIVDNPQDATFAILRRIDDRPDQPCPAPKKKEGYIPFEPIFLNGACTDVSLIRQRCTAEAPDRPTQRSFRCGS